MADFALDNAMDEIEHYETYKDAPMEVQYEEGIIDENGALIGMPGCMPIRRAKGNKPEGPGDCPICSGATIKKSGRFGDFYGCWNFPDCKGSRSI